MVTKKLIATGVLVCALSTHAWCSPASTEYVKASIDALRTELNAQIKALNTGVGSVQKQVNELPIVTHHIGEVFQGGMVFWVDASQQHGLMVSLTDLNEGEGIEWRNGEGGDRTVNAQAKGFGAGEHNTRLIIAEQTVDQQEGRFAALLAANFQISADGITPCPATITATAACYGGWYLPSVYELVALHSNLKRMGLGQLADEPYWSSTESNTTQAWLVDFSSGEPSIHEKSTPAHVRAIHAF
ncbi:TPA: DUF1566 domain-containing protein [Legionella pneumophila]